MTLAAEIAFFVLTAAAVAAFDAFVNLLQLPKGWLTLGISLATAEWLIERKRFWRTGVESALWIAGLVAFIFSLPSSGEPEALLVFVAAFAIAGWRLRSAVFGTAAVILVEVYLAVKEWHWIALLDGIAIALVAAAATARAWRRVSNEQLAGAIAVMAPIATYAAYAFAGNNSEVGVVLLFAIAAIFDLVVGVAFRVRAPLIASVVCIVIGCIEARDFIPITLEAELIIGGALMLATAAALMRMLRNRTSGIIVTPVERTELAEALQIGARGILLKDAAGEHLHSAVLAVYSGDYWIDGKRVANLVVALHELMAQAAQPEKKNYGLTPRELEVVQCIVEGRSNRDVARQFGISEETVKRHLSNVFDKTGVSTRLELAAFAISNQIVARRR